MSRRGGMRIELDVRTDSMPAPVLMCRSVNHPWQRMPVPGPRRSELLKDGLVEWKWHCLRCGSTRTDLFTLPHFERVRSTLRYCEGYLMAAKHRGTGRLGVSAARRAMYVRDDPALV